jgi:hypothetical protein
MNVHSHDVVVIIMEVYGAVEIYIHAFVTSEVQGREHIESFVRFEVFTVVTIKNCVFWEVTPCGSCKNRRFGGT